MKLPELEREPQFQVRDRVWVIAGKNLQEDRVSSILLELCDVGGDKQPVLICTGYRLGTANLDSSDFSFRPNEVYATEELAREFAQWHPVIDLSEADWKQAIGDREDDENLEECELSRCCAAISAIRDLLLKCQEDGGLAERDVRNLRQLLGEHEYPMHNGQRPANLDKIIGQLGLLDATHV